MRGVPGSNIRLIIPKGEAENETTISLNSDDFQQRTLASLGLVGAETDPGSEHIDKGPTLEILPMTLYVQTPSGRRIKIKDSLDVEATVDTLEEMVTKELEAANLLEASDSSEERFRLYHDRNPLRRGNKIARYRVKHMDILKLKFGTEEADANQKQERRKAYQKLEQNKAMRKSASAGNIRRLAKGKTERTRSSSPDRGAPTRRNSRATTPRKQRIAERTSSPSSESSRKVGRTTTPRKQRLAEKIASPSSAGNKSVNRRGLLQKTPSNDLLKRISQSLTNIRTSSFSPMRGLSRNHSCSSETQVENQPQQQPARRRMMKTRRDSSPMIATARRPSPFSTARRSSPVSTSRRPSPVSTARRSSPVSTARRPSPVSTARRSSPVSTTRRPSPRARSGSTSGRRTRRNIKTKTEERSSPEPRARSRSNTERRRSNRSKSRSTGERKSTQDSTRRRNKKPAEMRSRSAGRYRARDDMTDLKKNTRSRSLSRDREDVESRNSSKKSAHSEKTKISRSRSGPRKSSRGRRSIKDENKKPMEEIKARRNGNRDSSAKNLPEEQDGNGEGKKPMEETKPRRAWKRTSSTKKLPDEQAKNDKPSEESKSRRSWKSSSSKSVLEANAGIPDAFRISMHKASKRDDSEKETSGSPPSPVSVLSETLNMPQILDDASQESSDIQSDDTDVSVYIESTGNKIKEAKPMDFPKKPNAQESKNSNRPKRMTLQELKQAKEERNENAEVGGDSSRPNSEGSNQSRGVTSLRDLIEQSGNNTEAGKFMSKNSTSDCTSLSESSTIYQSMRIISQEPKDLRGGIESHDGRKIVSEEAENSKASPATSRSVVNRAKANFGESSSVTEPKNEVNNQLLETKAAGVPQNQTENNVTVNNFKAKYEKESPSPTDNTGMKLQQKDKKHPRSFGSNATKSETKVAKDNSSRDIGTIVGTDATPNEGNSAVRLAKAKFEQESATNKRLSIESEIVQAPPAKAKTDKTPPKRVRKRQSSTGLPEKVINELKDTLHGKDDEGKSAVERKKIDAEKPTVKGDSPKKTKVKSIESRAKSFGTTIKPLRPSSKDTQRRYSDDGTSVAAAAAEAMARLEASVVDEIKKEENGTRNSSISEKTNEASVETEKKQAFRKPIQPSSNDTPPVNSPATSKSTIKDRIGKFQNGNTNTKSPASVKGSIGKVQAGAMETTDSKPVGSIKDRLGKFQMEGKENINEQSPEPIKSRVGKFRVAGKENTKSPGAVKDRKGKIPNSGKENSAAKPRGSIKDRIGKFQTGGTTNTNSTGFQMIGLATLGLKNTMNGGSKKKEDIDRSESTTYSFFCSNDELSEYESSNFSESDCDSSDEDSDSDGEFESIHVIGPDLTPIEIPLDSDSETLGNIKGAVAKASGIPIDELRFSLQTEKSDLDESLRTNLDDDFKLTPGDILAVTPSTVIVKLPDGRSKLELSVFPGTLLSDIKEYIAKNTGTNPSRQLLYNFEENFDEELENDEPISKDCTLRLTVY